MVKAILFSNKNDANDAVCDRRNRWPPKVSLLRPKTVEQQDIQSLLRIRERIVENRTANKASRVRKPMVTHTPSLDKLDAETPDLGHFCAQINELSSCVSLGDSIRLLWEFSSNTWRILNQKLPPSH